MPTIGPQLAAVFATLNCWGRPGSSHSTRPRFVSVRFRWIWFFHGLQRFPVILDHSMIQYHREAP
jgi:hypothetical protein